MIIKPTRKKIDYSGLSIKTLKVELAICGVNTDDFLEKSDFVKALHEKKSSKSRKSARSSCKTRESKYKKDEKVLYISGTDKIAESARILEVHWTDTDKPFYFIRLDVCGKEKQTDDSRLVALPEKNVESPQNENKSEGKFKKAFENLKHLGRKDDLSPTRSSGSAEPKNCSLSLHPKSFSLSLTSRRKDELSSSSTHSRRSVGKKIGHSVSFSVSYLPSRKKDDLSTASTHSTSSSGSIFSFAKPERPQRRSAGDRPMKNVRRSCSPCNGSSVSSVSSVSMPSSMRSMGSQGSGHGGQVYKTRSSISPCRPASVSGFSEPKSRSPPARASSFGLASVSRQNREKRHAMRPSRSQGKGKHPTRPVQRTTSLPIGQSKP